MNSQSTAPAIAWTPRQREVLDFLAAGLTNGEIAERMGVSLAGAKWHVSEIISKLGVASREEAAAYWIAQGRARARLARMLSLPTLLKWAGVGGLTIAASGAAVALAAPLLDGGAGTPAAVEAATAPSAIFSETEAATLARELAVEVLGPFRPHSSGSDGAPGRPLNADDYAITELRFIGDATEAPTNVTGWTEPLDAPAPIWVARLVTRVGGEPAHPDDPGVLVTFKDGTGAILAGGLVSELAFPPDAVMLATTRSGYTRVWLAAVRQGDCQAHVDSRMPNVVGTACTAGQWPGSRPLALTLKGQGRGQGVAQVMGLARDDVARIRFFTTDGREVTVTPEPAPPGSGLTLRSVVAIAPDGTWFVGAEVLDAAGQVLDDLHDDWASFPTALP